MDFRFPLILDGATGSNLIAAGMKSGERTADFILEHQDIEADLIKRYVEAGSNVVYTPTFGVNPVKFGDKYEDTLRRLINLTKNAVEKSGVKGVYVAADISPCGLFAEPMGKATFDDIYNDFAAVAHVFESEDVDLFALETMYSLYETKIGLLACKENTKKPIITTVTVDANGKILTGSDICACVGLLGAVGASAAGVNCSTGPDDILKHIVRACEMSPVPVICKPNAGTDTSAYLSPEVFAASMKKVIDAGACVVGGCCGTSPDYIRELKAVCGKIGEKQFIKPNNNGKITLCTEKSYYEFDGEIKFSDKYDVEAFIDEFYDFDKDEFDAALIRINDCDDAEELLSSAYMFDIPLAVESDDISAIELLSRKYCGQIIITADCELEPEQKLYLSESYGSICL